jgi:hypothetical protein
MFKEILLRNFSVFDSILPGFMAMIHGGRSIGAALQIVDLGDRAPTKSATSDSANTPAPKPDLN